MIGIDCLVNKTHKQFRYVTIQYTKPEVKLIFSIPQFLLR